MLSSVLTLAEDAKEPGSDNLVTPPPRDRPNPEETDPEASAKAPPKKHRTRRAA